MSTFYENIVLFRMGERVALTLIVLVAALIIMIGFWRTIQKVDLSTSQVPGISGSFALATPVFVLLILVGYTWVSLSHPIASDTGVEDAGSGVRFTGMSGQLEASNKVTERDRTLAIGQLKSINCLGSLRDKELARPIENDIVLIKLLVMSQVWIPDWGDYSDFKKWAQGEVSEANLLARVLFEEVHPLC